MAKQKKHKKRMPKDDKNNAAYYKRRNELTRVTITQKEVDPSKVKDSELTNQNINHGPYTG